MFMIASVEAFPASAGGPYMYRAAVDQVRTKSDTGLASLNAAFNAVRNLVGTAMTGSVRKAEITLNSVAGRMVVASIEAYPGGLGGPFAYRVTADRTRTLKNIVGVQQIGTAFDDVRDTITTELNGDPVLWAKIEVTTG